MSINLTRIITVGVEIFKDEFEKWCQPPTPKQGAGSTAGGPAVEPATGGDSCRLVFAFYK